MIVLKLFFGCTFSIFAKNLFKTVDSFPGYLYPNLSCFQSVPVTQSIAVVPVRTKKRFTPPLYEPKYKSEKEFIERSRKAGVVIPPERLERPIHLACTGEAWYF